MKQLIAAIVFAVSSASAFAVLPCDSIGSLSRSVMEARQTGVALSSMLAIADKHPLTRDLVRRIIMDAYSRPRFNTKEFQERATDDFSTSWELSCHEVNEKSPKKQGGSSV